MELYYDISEYILQAYMILIAYIENSSFLHFLHNIMNIKHYKYDMLPWFMFA